LRNQLITLFLFLAGLVTGPAWATSGTVVDDSGRPIAGASACLIEDGSPLLCVDTDANGYYKLPEVRVNAVRIRKSGYIPATIGAVTQEAPIVLARAASLRARVVDGATGRPVGGGRIVVSYPAGRVLDDFPFTKGGTHVATIDPGAVKVRADLPGYRSEVVDVVLEAGREASITLTVRKER